MRGVKRRVWCEGGVQGFWGLIQAQSQAIATILTVTQVLHLPPHPAHSKTQLSSGRPTTAQHSSVLTLLPWLLGPNRCSTTCLAASFSS